MNEKRKMDEIGTMNEIMPHLLEEIIIEILLRSSPKSLSKFRCVSKPWSLLFNNLKLIEMIKNNFSIMLISGYDMYSIDNESLSSSLPNSIERIHRPLIGIFRGISVVGCCNGLFCIRNTGHHDFSLWNPSTGDCIRIPSPPGDQFQVGYYWNGHEGIGYGFGYDSKTDDYKLVCFISYFNLNQSEAKIYSLRSGSWEQFKRTQNIPWLLSSRSPRYGVFHNGALHWQSSSSSKALIAFHVTDGLTRGISPQKNSNFDKFYGTPCIDVLDGCLCMIYCNVKLGFEVWLMKNYGKKESWTKTYSISKLTSLETRSFGGLRRIECLKTGEILLEVYYNEKNGFYKEALVLYDPKNKTSMDLKPDKGTWSSNSLSFHRYVKSAVSVSFSTKAD